MKGSIGFLGVVGLSPRRLLQKCWNRYPVRVEQQIPGLAVRFAQRADPRQLFLWAISRCPVC